MIAHPLNLLLAVEPIRIVLPGEGAATAVPPAGATTPLIWWLGVATFAALFSIGLALLIHDHMTRRLMDPRDRVFERLARAMKLRHEESASLRHLAEALGAHPVALLISRGAFDRALEVGRGSADEVQTTTTDPGYSLPAIEALRRRLFPDPQTSPSGAG